MDDDSFTRSQRWLRELRKTSSGPTGRFDGDLGPRVGLLDGEKDETALSAPIADGASCGGRENQNDRELDTY